MGRIIILADWNDEDRKKLDWLSSELKKRDFEVIYPELTSTDDFEVWDKEFLGILNEFSVDTMVLAKGIFAVHLLNEFSSRSFGIKGLFIFTDKDDHYGLLTQDLKAARGKSLELFVYAFQTCADHKTLDSAKDNTDKNDAEFYILEGADDNSDYEDVLADILSLEHTD